MDNKKTASELRGVAAALRAREKAAAVKAVKTAAHVLRAAKGLGLLREKVRSAR